MSGSLFLVPFWEAVVAGVIAICFHFDRFCVDFFSSVFDGAEDRVVTVRSVVQV